MKMCRIHTMHAGLSADLACDAQAPVVEDQLGSWYRIALWDWFDAYHYDRIQPAWEYFKRATPPRTISYGSEEVWTQ